MVPYVSAYYFLHEFEAAGRPITEPDSENGQPQNLKLRGHVTSSVPCNDSKDFNPFYLCRETVGLAFKRGLVVEPSGAAALAAFLMGKVNFNSQYF